MDLGTNVPRDYFVAVLLASEGCPISNVELLKDGLWSAGNERALLYMTEYSP